MRTDLNNGPSSQQVVQQVQQFGPNQLVKRGGRSSLTILWNQLTNVIVLILVPWRCWRAG
ncbi:MAG: cation-transporting P-type ATPase [Candidatus Promineifilaceae bacterium]